VRSTGYGTGDGGLDLTSKAAADATRPAGDLHLTCKAVADGGGTSAATVTAAGTCRCCSPAGQRSAPLLTRFVGKSANESSLDGAFWLEERVALVLSRPLRPLVAWVDGRVGDRFIEGGWTFLEKVRIRPPDRPECLLSPSMFAQ